jgi:hypothetical protein
MIFNPVPKPLNILVKVKEKFPLCLTSRHVWEWKVYCYSFITLALDGGRQSGSCFTLEEIAFGTHSIQYWVPTLLYVSFGIAETLLSLAGIEYNILGVA